MHYSLPANCQWPKARRSSFYLQVPPSVFYFYSAFLSELFQWPNICIGLSWLLIRFQGLPEKKRYICDRISEKQNNTMDINRILSKFIGNKADRDMREVQPMVEKVQAVYGEIKALSNDELRERSDQLKKRVREYVDEEVSSLDDLRKKSEDPEVDIRDKEQIYKDIDKIEKDTDRDYFMASDEALKYGLIDEVIDASKINKKK